MGRDVVCSRHISNQGDRLQNAVRSCERRICGLRRVLYRHSIASRRIVPAIAALKNLPLPVPVRLGLLRLSPDELRVRVRRGRLFGWVTEWLIVHAWKACVPKGTGGSNPPPSAPASLSQAWMVKNPG